MSKPMHTPGPWIVDGKTKIITADRSRILCDAVYGFSPDHAKANARLIAACPEMLEALKYLYHQGMTSDAWRHVEPHEHARIQAYLLSVINKAEGREE